MLREWTIMKRGTRNMRKNLFQRNREQDSWDQWLPNWKDKLLSLLLRKRRYRLHRYQERERQVRWVALDQMWKEREVSFVCSWGTLCKWEWQEWEWQSWWASIFFSDISCCLRQIKELCWLKVQLTVEWWCVYGWESS